jgi:hypothetical protein
MLIIILSAFLAAGCNGGGGGDDGSGDNPDMTAPTVLLTVPDDLGTGVAVNQVIAAVFSKSMSPSTINSSTFTLKNGAVSVSGTVTYTGFTASFRPSGSLEPDTYYTATITTGAEDLAGNALAEDYSWTFTTGTGASGDAPTVTMVTPANLAVNVPFNQKMAAAFSEVMDPSSITEETFLLKQGDTPVSGDVTYIGQVATFKPTVNLATNTTYTATITTGARSLSGTALADDYTWSFSTGASADISAPTVTLVNPADLATGVPINQKITATFSKVMDPLTINTSTFSLKQGTTTIPGAVTYVGLVAIFTPTGNLTPNTKYTATITTGATDLAGNALAANFTWSFTTGVTLDITAPTVTLVSPANLETGVAINRKINATFSKPMDATTITTTTFTLKQGTTPVSGAVTYVGLVATFRPNVNLAISTTYTATITTGAKDLAGNALVSAYTWSFTTGTNSDLTAPTVLSTNPANLAIGVVLNKKINATFSKPMDPLTMVTANFKVTGPGTTPVVGTVVYDLVNNIITFTPTSNLAVTTLYTATVTTGAMDVAGNALAADYTWSFTTGTTLGLVPINLGSGGTFAVMARSSTTSTGLTQVNGDVGLSPGTSQGIPPSQINGTIHINDSAVIQAQADLLAAYNEAIALSTNSQTLPGNMGGLTFTPGLYTNSTSVLISGGNVTLDAQGDAGATFVFKMGSTLTTAPGTQVILIGGAKATNVFWQVGSSATLDTTTMFKGNILAAITITANTGSVIDGRLLGGLTTDGSVTLNATTVSVPAP